MLILLKCEICGRAVKSKRPGALSCCKALQTLQTNAFSVCTHRGEVTGAIDCECEGKPLIYRCKLLNDSCTQHPINRSKVDPGIIIPKPCSFCKFRDLGLAKWQPTEDDHRATHDNLIITIAVGPKSQEILDFTGPAMADYADKCGAQFVVLNNPTQNWWGLEKFRVHRFAQQHQKTLFLDADVFVRRDAPSLFDVLPPGWLGIYDDYGDLKSTSFLKSDLSVYEISSGVSPLPSTCLNSGVVLTQEGQANTWKPPEFAFRTSHTMEQTIVEQNIRKAAYSICRIHKRWNCQFWHDDFQEREPSSHFIHLANAPHAKRIELLRKLIRNKRYLQLA